MYYFDYAATSPISEAALDAYVQAARTYDGNTQSLHEAGSKASRLVEECRTRIASLAGVEKRGLHFTSGGTESNMLAVQLLLAAKQGCKHLITSQAEHSSIHILLEKLKREGYDVTSLPLTNEGVIDAGQVEEAIREDTAVVIVQHVNAEIGAIQPVEAIGRLCREKGVYFHSDCVQSFGKIDVKKISPFVDSFSISSHKIYGPKGVGAMYIHPSIPITPLYPGAIHEKGLRPGTLNVPGIAGFAVAADQAVSSMEYTLEQHHELFETMKDLLVHQGISWYTPPKQNHLPSIIGIGIDGLEGQWVMLEANRKGVAISTGSACQAGMQSPSKTMLAMGIPEEEAKTFIRISLGKTHTKEDIEALVSCLTLISTRRHNQTLV
ncbi:IscS subfamily cysteine desulfurase [Thalassobacillus hwangdonensis]|uniref:IscS subfamily cysteine desulfurase n=1 Tax=Thalassobacillus hwangdonensis TaxID=546108 RepID=A0ABW3L0A0_9BACI